MNVPKEFKNKKCYLSGKMTGLTVRAILKIFGEAEKQLLKNDVAVMNPAVMWYLKDTTGFTSEEYLKIDFAMLSVCDIMLLLPNYKTSLGAKREIEFAKEHNIPIYVLDEDFKEISELPSTL